MAIVANICMHQTLTMHQTTIKDQPYQAYMQASRLLSHATNQDSILRSVDCSTQTDASCHQEQNSLCSHEHNAWRIPVAVISCCIMPKSISTAQSTYQQAYAMQLLILSSRLIDLTGDWTCRQKQQSRHDHSRHHKFA
jgi:hypothetical protein